MLCLMELDNLSRTSREALRKSTLSHFDLLLNSALLDGVGELKPGGGSFWEKGKKRVSLVV